MDNRKTLDDLRERIAQELNLGKFEFTMKRGARFGTELKDVSKKIKDCGIINSGHIVIEFGTPCLEDEVRIVF